MKMIDKMLDALHEEVEGAKEYAEKYINCKAKGHISEATKYKEMSNDELKHAGYLREMDLAEFDELKKVYEMTEDEQEKWERGHNRIGEQMALVKRILTM